jgi:HEPN domain-containing protein
VLTLKAHALFLDKKPLQAYSVMGAGASPKRPIMTSEEKYAIWLQYAQEDLDSADAMYAGGRWFHTAYMCQQALEKHCKGLYNFYIGDDVPRIHNIPRLLNDLEEKLSIPIPEEVYKLADMLSGLYLYNRYPDFKERSAAKVDKTRAAALLAQTKDALKWLLTLKK